MAHIQKLTIRKPAVAGAFYPSQKKEIEQMLNVFFKTANADENLSKLKISLKNRKIHGIIVPHAGWIYSGGVAAYAYELVRDKRYKRIILLGPNHTVYIDRAVLDENQFWETPLGKVKLLKEKTQTLLKEKYLFIQTSGAHEREHDLEVQIPFLQYILKDNLNDNHFLKDNKDNSQNFEILPIIIGDMEMKELERVADCLLKDYNDEETLFVISTDLSHYQPQETAEKLDRDTIKIIETLDVEKADNIDACGRNPLIVAMFLCKKLGVTPITLKYGTSGDVSGDYSGVVGYVSMVF